MALIASIEEAQRSYPRWLSRSRLLQRKDDMVNSELMWIDLSAR